MKTDSSKAEAKKNSSDNFSDITAVEMFIQYLTTFAWSHKCLAEERSTSYTNLCIIPHRELRQSSGALSDASIKTIFSPSPMLKARCLSPAREDGL